MNKFTREDVGEVKWGESVATFQGATWPRADGWRFENATAAIRNGKKPSMEDRQIAADVMVAYFRLITRLNKDQRDQVCRVLLAIEDEACKVPE